VDDLDYAVREAWREALEVEDCKQDDNFFNLGGDSLAAVVVTQIVFDETGVDVPLEALFTVDTMAEYIFAVREAANVTRP
jgi:acyl carrier protein